MHFTIYFESKFEQNPTILTIFSNSFCSYLLEVPPVPGLHQTWCQIYANLASGWYQACARLVPDLCQTCATLMPGWHKAGASLAQAWRLEKSLAGRPQLEDFRTEV